MRFTLVKTFFKRIFSKKQQEKPVAQKASTLAEASSNTVDHISPLKKPQVTRPLFEKMYPYVFCMFLAYCLADLSILLIRDKMLPQSGQPLAKRKMEPTQRLSRQNYISILNRNIFNSDGIIPDPLNMRGSEQVPQNLVSATPVPTTLPFILIGTIVHINPNKAVATIKIGGDKVFPYRVNDSIEGMATLLDIKRKKAIFRNERNGSLEYVEIKDNVMISLAPKNPPPQEKESISRRGNDFALQKSDIDKHLENLPELLQQARAVPNIVPGTGGQIDGFRILDMQPGSIYENLGLQVGDVLKSVNGDDLTSPAKAMELFHQLKSENQISLDIERGGRTETFNYSIE